MRITPRRLVVVGSALVDILLYVDALPPWGSASLASSWLATTGGAFNLLVAAARSGLAAAYGGLVGDGSFGHQIARDFGRQGVAQLIAPVTGKDSGFDVGFIGPDGETTFIVAPGVESQLTPEDLGHLPLRPGDAIYISGYDLTYEVSGASLASWIPGLGSELLVVFDPGPLIESIAPARLAAVLARTDVLSLNARESALLSGTDDVERACLKVSSRVPARGLVVSRNGGQGCYLCSPGNSPLLVPPRPARVTDTTGAGDTHTAVLLAGLGHGEDVVAAALRANVAASLSVEKVGPTSAPTGAEVQAALNDFREHLAER